MIQKLVTSLSKKNFTDFHHTVVKIFNSKCMEFYIPRYAKFYPVVYFFLICNINISEISLLYANVSFKNINSSQIVCCN